VRLLERGHHPAGRLANELAERWSLPCDCRLLTRGRPSARQTGLGLAERGRNVRGAFTAMRAVPRDVLLVDDVYTTGATASAAASALKAAGATTVRVVTFARAVRLP
jgi:predicted amidophosphoribosyltransferase